MRLLDPKRFALIATLFALNTLPAHALPIFISEVDAAGSTASTGYAADWFELTNYGSTAIDITGWKMDDNSNSFASAVALRGVTSIAAGQSVVFIEGNASGSNDSTVQNAFKTAWFGSSVPSTFVIGGYGGSGVGLGQTGDAVNIFDAAGNLVTRVDIGSSALGNTFDNAAGLSGATISQFSAVGVNSAFTSANGLEVGSPGLTVSPVPEPETYAMMLAGLGLLGFVARRRKQNQAPAV